MPPAFRPRPTRAEIAMLRLGLTGGIASGKSEVARILRELGFTVLDADSIGHELMQPDQPAYREIVRQFGNSILDADRRVQRGKLAAVVFADRQQLERLNAILHPRVRERLQQLFRELDQDTRPPAAFVEAALLVEAGYLPDLDGLVVCWTRPEQQLDRLRARGLSEEAARLRIAAQLPAEEKLKFATETIDCSGTLEETQEHVEALAAKLRRA
jgi:dephospho-CoA kinase